MMFANATKFYRKSGAAEGSAVQRTFRGNVFLQSAPGFPATHHWTMPRMRLSVKEKCMNFANATNFNRKSGAA